MVIEFYHSFCVSLQDYDNVIKEYDPKVQFQAMKINECIIRMGFENNLDDFRLDDKY